MLLLLAAAAAAQCGPISHSDEDQVPAIAAAPPGRSLDYFKGGSVALEVAEKKSSLTLGYQLVHHCTRGSEDNLSYRTRHEAYKIELSLPLGGSDNLLDSKTFGGLGDGAGLTVAYTLFGTSNRDRFDDPPFRAFVAQALANCLAQAEQEADRTKCETDAAHPRTDFVRQYSRASEAAINRAILSPGWAVGVEGGVGLNQFKYQAPLTLEAGRTTKPYYSLKVYGAYFPADAMSAFTLSGEYRNTYKAQDDEILCRSPVVKPNEDCVKAAPGAPRHGDALLVAAEYRRVLGKLPHVGQVALAPQATLDTLSGDYELSLPVYITPTRNIGVLPGFSITYSSKERDWVFGVFLKQTFGF